MENDEKQAGMSKDFFPSESDIWKYKIVITAVELPPSQYTNKSKGSFVWWCVYALFSLNL